MTATGGQWRTGWTAKDPAYVGYAWAPNEGGSYENRHGDGLLYRDLGLDAASEGKIGCSRLRLDDRERAGEWRSLDVDFDFLFVLRGTVTVERDAGQTVALQAGGCAVQPGNAGYRLSDFSDDFDAVHVTSPASYELLIGGAAQTADEASRPAVFTHNTDDQYTRGNGPRAFFLYRDLGTSALTDERIHFHVVRATEPGLGTGWHYHTMSQWFMVIGGSADISVEDHPKQPLGWGDAMCVGSGERMRHNVTDFSSDYLVLEMCVPAQYDTIAVERPEGGADTPI